MSSPDPAPPDDQPVSSEDKVHFLKALWEGVPGKDEAPAPHVEVLRRFGMQPMPGVRLTLITREAATPYSGMLPGLVAGTCAFDDAHINTASLTRFAGAHCYHDEAVGLDTAHKLVLCRDRPPVPYDVLSIDIGSRPNTRDVEGAAEHAIPLKPIDRFLPRLERIRQDVIARHGRAAIALVGAGAAGVELLLALQARLRADIRSAGGDPGALSLTLVAGGDDILPAFPASTRAAFRRVLRHRDIDVVTRGPVVRADADRLVFADGKELAAAHILWATQASAPAWLKETGLALSPDGFLRVDATLRAVGHAAIFAAGDVAAFDPWHLPRSGVYAVRAGPVIARNIRALIEGRPLVPYRPQRHALYLVSTADGRAIGTRNTITFSGAWAGRWKERIDRRFMARFDHLPDAHGGPNVAMRSSGRSGIARIFRRLAATLPGGA